ncbi:unnamed protein product [Adineta ricciae]|nr:unnamed protein product [Adineta ricciae]
MWESANTTATNLNAHNSQLSFYEYPPEKPFTNSIYQPLRSSTTLSRTVTLPESNRDQLLTALQSLTLKIKTLENERERAESNLRQITNDIHRSRTHHKLPENISDKRANKLKQELHSPQDLPCRNAFTTNEERSRKSRLGTRRKKRSSQEHHSCEPTNTDARHFHLDMNSVPFILGASTSPSHNVKSNVQNVIALLKNHNHQLCLSSKEYSDLHHTNGRSDLSPHTILYLDHYNKSSRTRPSSASPIRAVRRSVTTSPSERPHRSALSEKQCHSRIKRLRQEFATLAREHTTISTSRNNSRELEILNLRMELILDELERLQRLLKLSVRKTQSDKIETPLETLRKTKLLQTILKDPSNNQHYQGHSRRSRPKSND